VSNPERDHWFEDLADHLGSAYLRYSFTKGTKQEVRFLVEELELEPGMRVLDVGCGPGRHAYELAELGIEVHGVDISERFIDIAKAHGPDLATFERCDARHLSFEAEFDAVISLCQGAFGLAAGGQDADNAPLDPDGEVLNGIARALKPGSKCAVSAFSAYFQVRHIEAMGSEFDALRGVNHEVTTLKDEAGNDTEANLWTTCFTPRELRLLSVQAGLKPIDIWSVTPGRYGREVPSVDSEEFLLVAQRP